MSYLARYSGHAQYAYQLRRWFSWCRTNALDPLIGVQRAHVDLCIAGDADAILAALCRRRS